jgi:DNA-binding beta-propeller fold protein YncE
VAGSIAGPGATDNANPSLAQLNGPRQIAADASGNLYIADGLNHTIRRVAVGGGITTIAGTPGVTGNLDSPPLFNGPRGIAVTPDGNTVYVYDSGNKMIRRLVNSGGTWTVSTLTSALGNAGYGQMALDPTGAFLVIADYASTGGNCIRVLRLSDGVLGVYAGTPGTNTYGTTDNTTPDLAKFDNPEGLAFNKAGTYFYVSEYFSTATAGSTSVSRIRMVPWTAPPASPAAISPSTTGTVITIAGSTAVAPATPKGFLDGPGSTALFNNAAALAVDGNDALWVADSLSHVVRKIVVNSATPGDCTVTTVAGTVPTGPATAPVVYSGSTDGAALSARFNTPNGILCVGTKVYVSDTNNGTIRAFDGTTVSTPVGTPLRPGNTDAVGPLARFNGPQGVATYGGLAYVADTGNNLIRVVSLLDGTTSTHPATGFTQVKGVAISSTGTLYVTDNGATKAVYQLAADGTKTTVFTTGLVGPANVTVSPSNPNLLYVTDGNAVIEITITRNLDGSFASAAKTKTIGLETTAAGTWVDNADPTLARFKINGFFAGLAVDGSGNIFLADEGNSCIRKIAATTYAVTTVAGMGTALTGTTAYGFIDGPLNTNKFNYPMGLVLDAAGNLYVAENGNHTIRKMSAADGSVSTLIGLNYVALAPNGASVLYGASTGVLGGGASGASLYKPFGLAITSDGDLLVVTNNGLMQVTAP